MNMDVNVLCTTVLFLCLWEDRQAVHWQQCARKEDMTILFVNVCRQRVNAFIDFDVKSWPSKRSRQTSMFHENVKQLICCGLCRI